MKFIGTPRHAPCGERILALELIAAREALRELLRGNHG
jgi:hypothetical protein